MSPLIGAVSTPVTVAVTCDTEVTAVPTLAGMVAGVATTVMAYELDPGTTVT